MKTYILIILQFIITHSFSQNIENCQFFQIKTKNQVIDYYVYKTSEEKKPLLLFCQGSLPVPLFIKIDDYHFNATLSNFDLKHISDYFHIVVISKPFTPVVVPIEQLNESHCYITDTTQQYSFDENYVKSDYLDNYVFRANKILKELKKLPWIDNNNWVLAGHSQGAREAVAIANSNSYFKTVGLFGYDSKGRYESSLRQLRKDAEGGKITWEQADSSSAEILKWHQEFTNHADGMKSIKSFNVSSINELLKIEIPIYIAYGSNDIIADACDYLPFYFSEKNKTNLTLIRYGNLEHNFFPILPEGQTDYENGKWKDVMNSFIDFTLNIK